MSPLTYFPLRWESTGDQWWYASPIDYAAANGHYDLVRELLRLDGNNLIKLASLRRLRRLETVWDDEEQFHHVAKNRSEVARKLLSESEIKKGNNSLVGSGYGGWLLYTAASAGDSCFVRELLDRDPLLVFGEGEYGVTDILYAASRSKSFEIFKVVLDFAISPRFSSCEDQCAVGDNQLPEAYRSEITNRAAHALARGGNLKLFKEFLDNCSDDVFAYRDNRGSTVMHAAAARGQVEIIRYLTSASDLINSTDNLGNTALHVAAHRGHLSTVEALILASPSLIRVQNNSGETFLHSVITGFQSPGFQRLDRQIELMKQILSNKLFSVEEIVNVQTTDRGLTPLNLAITLNIHSDLVELLMSVDCIDVNIKDANGMTPLDILKKQPVSSSSELLTRQLISAGGIFSSRDDSTRKAIASHIRRQSVGSSPGTSFRINDAEIFLFTGLENEASYEGSHSVVSACHSPVRSQQGSTKMEENDCTRSEALSSGNKIIGSVASSAARRLKRLIRWPNTRRSKKPDEMVKKSSPPSKEVPISLRERFAKRSSNNKRARSVRSSVPSPSTAKKKLASGLLHGVMQAVPDHAASRRSRSASFSKMSVSSQSSVEYEVSKPSSSYYNAREDGIRGSLNNKHGLVDNRLINQLLGFDDPREDAEASTRGLRPYDVYERSVLSAA